MKTVAATTFALILFGAGTALADTTTINNTNTTVNNTETNLNCTQCNVYMPATPAAAPEKKEFRIKICNESRHRISLAIGYRTVSAANDWRFKGWYNLGSGDCQSMAVDAGNRSALPYVYHAHSFDGTVTWGKGTELRMPNERFDFTRFENGSMRIEGKLRPFTVESADLKGDNLTRLTGG